MVCGVSNSQEISAYVTYGDKTEIAGETKRVARPGIDVQLLSHHFHHLLAMPTVVPQQPPSDSNTYKYANTPSVKATDLKSASKKKRFQDVFPLLRDELLAYFESCNMPKEASEWFKQVGSITSGRCVLCCFADPMRRLSEPRVQRASREAQSGVVGR